MTPRELIAEAWHITTKHKRILLPWGMTDAVVLLISSMGFTFYQGYALMVYFRTGLNPSWQSVMGVITQNMSAALVSFLILLSIIYFILWLVVPRLATGALIGLAAKIHYGEEPKGGLVLGVYNFVPLLELAAAMGLIGGKVLFSVWSMLIRYMGGDAALFTTTALVLIIWLLFFLLHFLLTFSEEAIVIRKVGIFRALGQSFKLVISYLSKVVLIFVLLLVIILRIIINAFIILVVPSLVMGIGLLLARVLPSGVSFGISSGIGFLLMLFASYFIGYITVFKHTVWTVTYIELSKERELDLVIPEKEKKEEDKEEKEEKKEEGEEDTTENEEQNTES